MTGPLDIVALAADERQAGAIDEARRLQGAAADPVASAWVSANAGTGKTHVLVQRILRLLLSGAEPQSLLCLTYTRNAATEMEARVLRELGCWAVLLPDELDTALSALLGRAPLDGERDRARCLFAVITDAARGLPIMTIHSFCEQVLRRFPVEAGIAPNFTILSDDEARQALAAAVDAALDEAARRPGTPLGEALAVIAANTDDTGFAKLIAALLPKRATVRALLAPPDDGDAFDLLRARLNRHFGLGAGDSAEAIRQRQLALVADLASLSPAFAALSGNAPTDRKTADRMRHVLEQVSPRARLSALRKLFLTEEGKPRAALLTKAGAAALGSAADRLEALKLTFGALDEELAGAKAVEASVALLRLANQVFELYEAEKRARCAADFDELIEKTLALLMDPSAAGWVLYQLDARIDHILVDEAQDTSAAQWAIIECLTGDFFAGEGARERPATLFAVGDVKQSIYSFQGAEPRLMIERERHYETRVQAGGQCWRSVQLGLSFRSASAILDCVDAVWRRVEAAGDAAGAPFIPHRARRDAPGLVQLWEPEKPAPRHKGETWSPEQEEEQIAASRRLAERIAHEIAGWLERGEFNPARGRAMQAGDILILLKTRDPMLDLLLAALKLLGVPVAGADRLALLDSIAVMDLIALGNAAVFPADDLALAAALKSPLFGLDDDDLFALAYGRPGSLREALRDAAGRDQRFQEAEARLRRWERSARRETPFDFYHRILDGEDLRLAFTARLGLPCTDALNEFLDLAAQFEAGNGTLSQFLVWVHSTAAEVKREPDQKTQAVRIMTVHGAKGLEADIVILADTCRSLSARSSGILTIDDGLNLPPIPLWLVKGSDKHPAIARAKEANSVLDREESMRLLYVAMTRARDRLYIAGFQDRDRLPDGCWYDLVFKAVAGLAEEHVGPDGRKVWRVGKAATVGGVAAGAPPVAAARVTAPAWSTEVARAEPPVRLLAPSLLAGDELTPPALSASPEQARLAGLLTHRLLQTLPDLREAQWAEAAAAIAADYHALEEAGRGQAVAEALASLRHPALRDLFALPALPEAAFAGYLDTGEAEAALLFGQADRIVLDGDSVLVLDYKTNRRVPKGAGDIPRSHLAQVAAYCALCRRLFPGRPIRGALLYTAGPALLEIPGPALDTVMADLRQMQPPLP